MVALFILGLIVALLGVGWMLFGDELRGAGAGALAFGVLLILISCFRTVSPGTVGVPVTFGTVDTPRDPGITFVAPWTGIEGFETRTINYTMDAHPAEGAKQGDDSMDVKGHDGATAKVDSTLLYHIDPKGASTLFKEIGSDYEGRIVRPAARSCIPDAYSKFDLVDGVTSKRDEVQSSIKKCMVDKFGDRGIVLEDFQLRAVHPSDEVQKSIDSKVAAQQNAQKKDFELQQAAKQGDITRVENKATSDGQQIIRCGGTIKKNDDGTSTVTPNEGGACQNQLTPEYLQWLYINLFGKIVESPNHDTVVIPAPSQGGQATTPLINIPTGK